jgi:ATP-dependent DNA ligase
VRYGSKAALRRRHDASVFLYAIDLIELNGDDLRRDPLQVRKRIDRLLITGRDRPLAFVGKFETVVLPHNQPAIEIVSTCQ